MDVTAIRSMPLLQSLDMSSCQLLRDIAPLANAAHLDTLDLSNCDNLMQLHPILTCPRLANLSLTAQQQYAGLTAVCAHVQHVRWLEPEFENSSSESDGNELSDLGQCA